MLLIYDDEKAGASASPEDSGRIMDAYYDFTDEAVKAGVVEHSDALQPTSTATTVRVRDGGRILADGPFAETKEQLGGFYIVKCESLDEAIEWAAKIPGATTGSIEIRPVMNIPPREQWRAESETAGASQT
jgi:hypothetical protein